MKNINSLGLFDDHFLMEKLTKLGDPLQKLNNYIDWKIFESPLDESYKDEDKDLSKGGRPPFSRLMMFKSLLIQSLYNLSDDQSENRDDELNLQYLSLCSIKISSCHGIGMPFRKNQNCTTN